MRSAGIQRLGGGGTRAAPGRQAIRRHLQQQHRRLPAQQRLFEEPRHAEGGKDAHDGKNETCTQLIPNGAEQALTITYNKPSIAQEEPFTLRVPGVDGQSIEVFVP